MSSGGISRFQRLFGDAGQATVEFALILPVLLLIVVGILDFGRATNYYNTLTELAAEGARSAAVNVNPDGTAVAGKSIQNQIKCTAISTELSKSNTYHVTINSVGTGNPDPIPAGQPVQVQTSYDFRFIPFLNLATITLQGSATMRAEQASTYTLGQDSVSC
jgi:Flp pilus assembly protein TadG